MTVYVDASRNNGWVMYGKSIKSCHMIADDEEELHAMASRIGLRRGYAQSGSLLHYDLTDSKRYLAIKNGAVPLSNKNFVKAMKNIKEVS